MRHQQLFEGWGQPLELDSSGVGKIHRATYTRLQIANLRPLQLPATAGNLLYVNIVNTDGAKNFFGTLHRNKFLLNELQKKLHKISNPMRLLDPAPGEVVLVRTNEAGFLRGSIMRKTNFMTCTTYLIDCGVTMEVPLDDFYMLTKKLRRIPPQAFLMQLDGPEIDQMAISQEELDALVRCSVVAFRLSKFLFLVLSRRLSLLNVSPLFSAILFKFFYVFIREMDFQARNLK
ncbi:unnamed protein product [Gongylonema pulchrum]|uniref:Tudor domain-containing protein n=1 Tax=Gongylonema pulchrum TaxID=637853 RepID=A0A183CUM9_9BILA|nr:unnamed protein product [Gongylonema pulchrum]